VREVEDVEREPPMERDLRPGLVDFVVGGERRRELVREPREALGAERRDVVLAAEADKAGDGGELERLVGLEVPWGRSSGNRSSSSNGRRIGKRV
jgi:hypothetical protein